MKRTKDWKSKTMKHSSFYFLIPCTDAMALLVQCCVSTTVEILFYSIARAPLPFNRGTTNLFSTLYILNSTPFFPSLPFSRGTTMLKSWSSCDWSDKFNFKCVTALTSSTAT